MAFRTYKNVSTRKTPVTEPIPGRDMVRNNTGGYVFEVGDWDRLNRFLILGTSGGTYYVKERELTRGAADAVLRCIRKDGVRVVRAIVDVSRAGRAPSNDPALFALAMAIKLGDLPTRRVAAEALSEVARTGTHRFHLAAYIQQFGGWSRLTRKAFARAFNEMEPEKLAYQFVKYQQRDGWSNADLIKLSHPNPPTPHHDLAYRWALGKDLDKPLDGPLSMIAAFEEAKKATVSRTITLIRSDGLTHEMINTEHKGKVEVWEALLDGMPMWAMLRNLGKMTQVGLIQPMSAAEGIVCARLKNPDRVVRARLHPLSILVAMRTYGSGGGYKGSLHWSPSARVLDALDEAFHLSFGSIEPTYKRIYLALDVSGSMTSYRIAGTPLVARDATAAMAMTLARVEPNHYVAGFCDKMVDLPISPRQRLDDAMDVVHRSDFGATAISLPMLDALKRGMEIDAFVVMTDYELNAGPMHPIQAIQEYRSKTGIPAKLVTVGMVSTEFGIADPDDAGMLDVVGYDTATPQVISDFLSG